MQLHRYLKQTNISVTDFAKLAKLSRHTIYALVNRRNLPTLLTIRAIDKASLGSVRFEDWQSKKGKRDNRRGGRKTRQEKGAS